MHLDNYKSLKDEEIISIILQEHKTELFEILYQRYSRKVLDKCYTLLKHRELAEESRQNIFEKTYEKLNTFKGTASFLSWLYSITYNYCIDYLRNKNKLHYPEWNSNHEIPEIIEESQDDQEEINYERLVKILEMIHPEEKALLLMKYSDNLSIQQIGQALRISESATKMRIKRAKARVLFIYKEIYKD
ncbi:MAG: RNA polymerase sigma factor [Bacteroidales bacterium]|nr:RNA polymerase sigma factor [Bacteroidales bacterium]